MLVENFRAMNSEIVLAAEGETLQVESGFAAVKNFIDTSEKRFTRFSSQSELSQLNRWAGAWFHASPELFEVVKIAQLYFKKTNGLFDPSILTYLKNAGYVYSMDEIRRLGTVPGPVSHLPMAVSTFASVELNETNMSIRLPADLQIDLGGIAKGWIAERAAHLLGQYTSACAVNAGGDMFLVGYPQGMDYWEVGLEDPRDPQVDITTLLVQEGAVATSSVAKRTWKQDTTLRHHLIDPRTGEPADTMWLSITVFAPQAVAAETFAKAFFIANEEEARILGEQNPELTVIAVDRNGNLVNLVKPLESLNVTH
jgi:thiamine biosynthesis lipoprotein